MAFTKKTLKDVDVKDKRVLVRVDFNVPLQDGQVTDDTRIRAALPTISYLKDQGAKIILMSHLGRPKGEGYEAQFSLAPVAAKLEELTGWDVDFVADAYGQEAYDKSLQLKPGQIMLLENVRFDKAEKKGDPEVAEKLSRLGDIFVLDAFGTAHRDQASVSGVSKYLTAVAGQLLEKEVDVLTGIFKDPERPFVAIVGGSKVSSKIGVLDHLIDVADTLIIGGGMAYTFLAAQGLEVGTSIQEPDWYDRALEMMDKARKVGCELLLPIDTVVASQFSADATAEVVDSRQIPADKMGMDIGPRTAELYARAIQDAKTVFWNGPMGVFEFDAFSKGTKAVAHAVADAVDATTIIGGGDSVAAVNKFGLADKMTWISTGGGASMELVEGKKLPGVEALLDA